MEFDDHGNLFPGEYILTLEQFRNEFVEKEYFNDSITRKEINNNFESLIKEIEILDMLDGLTKIWIDGSFSTMKMNPKDIDVIFFYDHTSRKKKQLEFYLDMCKFKMKKERKCHFNCLTDYINVADFNENEGRAKLDTLTKKQLVRYFEYDRENRNKGYISIVINTNQGGV